jgi:hypothetical protein
MRRTDAALLVACAGLLAFSVAYYVDPPAPRYYPLEHAWRMANEKGKPSMGWYGRSAWGLGAGLAAGLAMAVALRVIGHRQEGSRRTLPSWLLAVLTVASLLALVGASAEVVHHEFGKWGMWGAWNEPR